MMHLLRSLIRQQLGNATIELAFMTPVLLVMSLAAVDTAMGYVHRMNVQEQAQVGADYVYSKMEAIPSNGQIAEEIRSATGAPMTDISVSNWIECDNVKKPSENQCTRAGEVMTKFVRIEVRGIYNPILQIPYYANYVQSFTSTGSVTLKVG